MVVCQETTFICSRGNFTECGQMSQVSVCESDILVGQTLHSDSSRYAVMEFIGEGCFGKVAKCLNLDTREVVAVKILRQDGELNMDTEKEVSMMEVISALDADRTHVVKFFERFQHEGQTCLVYEMLDRNLYDWMEDRDWKPLSLHEVRAIAKQLLIALDALSSIGVLHTDIKPDNIMFVSGQDEPIKVKLIDFGEAIRVSDAQPGLEIQPTGYRAPEVALGLPFSELIDVWGVGCILAFLFQAQNLFAVECDYQMMKCMVKVLGMPAEHHLHEGIYTHYFFSSDGPTWRMLTSEEFSAVNGYNVEDSNFPGLPSSLDALVNVHPEGDMNLQEDQRVFVDFLKGLLHLDENQRLSAHQALQHPFITMSHMVNPQSDAYLTTANSLMACCQEPGSNNFGSPSWDGALVDEETSEEEDWDESSWVAVENSYHEVSLHVDEEQEDCSWEEPDAEKLEPSAPECTASTGGVKRRLGQIRDFFKRVAGNLFCCCCHVED